MNASSSEDFTESHNFNDFLNAKNSDDEDNALQTSKKNQPKGVANSKGPTTKNYPASYKGGATSSTYGGYGGGASYAGIAGSGGGYSGYGGGYGNASNSGGFATGGKAGSGYGSGYGAGAGYDSSSYGSGYGGGYGGDHANTYGSGYGGGNAYAGYDITGFGGSGYAGGGKTSAAGGYKDEDEGDEEEEEEGFDLDLKSVMERKAAQKLAKEAEEKKAEEEKAKAAKIALQQASKLKAANAKKDKPKSKVSFDLGEAIPDDSEDENNKNISHISEMDDSRSNDSDKREKKSKTAQSKPSPKNKLESTSKVLLNMSDDEKDRQSVDESQRKRSEEDSESDYYTNKASHKGKADSNAVKKAELPLKKDDKQNDVESSYTDDFEASSSKFGSSDYGKVNFKLGKGAEKKGEDFDESSNYNESKEAMDNYKTNKLDNKTSNEDRYGDQKDPTPNNKESKPNSYGALPTNVLQNQQTRIAKDYVYESLLKDEKRKIDKLESQLSLGGEQLRSIQELIQEKDINYHKLELQNEKLQSEIEKIKAENLSISSKNKRYDAENNDLNKRIDVLENKVVELESEKKILEQNNEDKIKALRERKDYYEKNIEAKITTELNTRFENEKDKLLMRIEELQDENKTFQQEIMKYKEDSRLYKTTFREKAEADQDSRKLKQEIMLLESKLKDREQLNEKKINNYTSTIQEKSQPAFVISGLDKEIQMQELLIRGFQKENEKLIVDNKTLKKEIEDLNGKLYDENKKITNMQVKLVQNTDSVLITDKEIDIETKKLLGSENLISKDDLRSAHLQITQLQKNLRAQEENFKQREIEIKYELDRLRTQKMELEAKYGGIDLNQLKSQDAEYNQLQKNFEQEKKKYEANIRDLTSKLNWYIENQDSIISKDEMIREKDNHIKNLEDELLKILSDPNSSSDLKSKQLNKIISEDKRRIKQLEKDVENLEEALKKRNPGIYDKLKTDKNEVTASKEAKETIKALQEEKNSLEREYELKLSDLRQKFDKMKLAYETKSGGGTSVKSGKVSNSKNDENVDVLKSRIKELENEVENAKNYYIMKGQQLKDNSKKSGGADKGFKSAKDLKNQGNKAPVGQKEPVNTIRIEDKENLSRVSNTVTEHQVSNLIDKLSNIHETPIYTILTSFEKYQNDILDAFRKNNISSISTYSKDFNKIISSTFTDFSQKEHLFKIINDIEDKIVTENDEPNSLILILRKKLHEIILSEMNKANSYLLTNSSKQQTRVNNYFDSGLDEDVYNRKTIVFEENQRKNQEELSSLQKKLETLAFENSRLQQDKANLELIIQKLPKNPKSLDFATLEKKLEIIEREFRESELELKYSFKKPYNGDPYRGNSESELNKIKLSYENEIIQLKNIIEKKNNEISTFRQQMEIILKEIDKLRRNK